MQRYLISTATPTPRQYGLAISLALLLVGVLLATVPTARTILVGSERFVPAYAAAIAVVELTTSALLLGVFSAERSRAILVLAAGYAFSAALIVPWALTFPGVFHILGLESGLQDTAAIAATRRIGFPLFVIGYALLKGDGEEVDRPATPVVPPIVITLTATLAGAAVIVWLLLGNAEILPAFMSSSREVTPLWHYVPALVIPLYCVVLGVLWFRLRSVLDLWLMVVIATLLIELVLLSYVSGGTRLSAGWWAGRVCGLVSASIVQFALLAETVTLYARLASSIAAERQMREARLTAMEALSASIAHEVNQPVSSMVTSANAALRWLGKQPPDIAEAGQALERIVGDGHRAGAVIANIRTMFQKAARQREPVEMNPLIMQVLKRSAREARLARMTIEAALDPAIPPINGNRIQLEQVVWNLLSNAIEAGSAETSRSGRVRITTGRSASGDVLVSVEDCGRGVDAADREAIFAPFFTTKPDGMGMGLMLCRSVIEAHGGSLWTEPNQPQGAIFRFSLPPLRGERHQTGQDR